MTEPKEKKEPKKIVAEETKIIRFLLQDLDQSDDKNMRIARGTYKPTPRFEFFIDQYGNPSTSIEGVVYGINSTQFKDRAGYEYYVEKDRIFGNIAWDKALSYIKTIAKNHARFCPMRCHIKESEGETSLYYDTVDYIYKIQSKGETFERTEMLPKDSAVKFRRNQYTQSAPVHFIETDMDDPGKIIIEAMSKFKVEKEYSAVIVASFCDKHNQPISMFVGPAGSAKSSFQTFVKRNVDPTSGEKIKLRDKNIDWVTMIDKFYCLDFDNVRDIKEEEADDLCRGVTGGSILRRTLYTTNDLSVFEGRPRILMNGISPEPTKFNDLLDRTIICSLERISDADRLPDSKISAYMEEIIPRVRSCCLMLLCRAYNKMWTYNHKKLPRMAEFARLCDSIWVEMGNEPGKWIEWYYGKVAEASSAGLEDELYTVLSRYLHDSQNQYFLKESHTSNDILNDIIRFATQYDEGFVHPDLNRIVNMKEFPKTAVYFGRRLREMTPILQSISIELKRVHTKSGSEYRFVV